MNVRLTLSGRVITKKDDSSVKFKQVRKGLSEGDLSIGLQRRQGDVAEFVDYGNN